MNVLFKDFIIFGLIVMSVVKLGLIHLITFKLMLIILVSLTFTVLC